MKQTYLDFEQPIAELETKIEELRFVQDDSVLDISEDAFSIRKSLKFFTRAGSYAEKFANAHGIAISNDYQCMADDNIKQKQKYYLEADKGPVNL